MKGPNQRDPASRIAHWAPRQAATISERALAVLYVDENKNPISSVHNSNHAVDSVVVVGPGYNTEHDVYVQQAVLLEIGKRVHPYKRSRGTRENSVRTGPRHRYVDSPTKEALSSFLPALETVLSDVTIKNLRKRKSLWHERGKCLIPASLRFSVSMEDSVMVASVLQSQLIRKRVPLAVDMKKRADWIHKCLCRYDLEHASLVDIRKEMEKKGSGLCRVSLWYNSRNGNLLPHHWSLILQGLHGRSSEGLFYRLMEHWKINQGLIKQWGEMLCQENIPTFSENVWISSTPLRYKGVNKNTHMRFNGHYLPREYMRFDFTPVNIVTEDEDVFNDMGEVHIPQERVFNDPNWTPF